MHPTGIEPTTSRLLLHSHVLYRCATTAAIDFWMFVLQVDWTTISLDVMQPSNCRRKNLSRRRIMQK